MFGGLRKTSSRIAIAASLGVVLGGYALSSPAQAGDYGGDCCADLEERVAELEATTVRKGNKKVSVTLSGWVVKSINWWDDGAKGGFAVGDKDYDLGSRFAITGAATIAPGWSAGYNLTVTAGGTTYGIRGNPTDEYESVNGELYGSSFGHINTLYSYVFLKSDAWGTLNWGHLSPASDNPAVLADISGTVIESNFVGFEGGGFPLRARGAAAGAGWNDFWLCNSGAAPGADCFGTAQPAVRYDSPTWGGFRFETSYGTYDVVPAILDTLATNFSAPALNNHPTTQKSNFWDAAVFYNDDWGSFKVSAAYAFTWLESNPLNGGEENIHQVGATILHSPSGLGLYATGNWESVDKANNSRCPGFTTTGANTADPVVTVGGDPVVVETTTSGCLVSGNLPSTKTWGIKPFIQGNWWNGVGKTIFYGEYAQYSDFFGFALANGVANSLPVCTGAGSDCRITGSEMDRWGLGVVQEIDAAAMHLWLRWQHQDLDVSLVDNGVGGIRRNQGFDNYNLIQGGGIIFF